jgi:hypothetical protein
MTSCRPYRFGGAQIHESSDKTCSGCCGAVVTPRTTTMPLLRGDARQRRQQHALDPAEDRGVGADAEPRMMTATAVNAGRRTNMRQPETSGREPACGGSSRGVEARSRERGRPRRGASSDEDAGRGRGALAREPANRSATGRRATAAARSSAATRGRRARRVRRSTAQDAAAARVSSAPAPARSREGAAAPCISPSAARSAVAPDAVRGSSGGRAVPRVGGRGVFPTLTSGSRRTRAGPAPDIPCRSSGR